MQLVHGKLNPFSSSSLLERGCFFPFPVLLPHRYISLLEARRSGRFPVSVVDFPSSFYLTHIGARTRRLNPGSGGHT